MDRRYVVVAYFTDDMDTEKESPITKVLSVTRLDITKNELKMS